MKKIQIKNGVNSLNVYGHENSEDTIEDPINRVKIISRANNLKHDAIALPDFHYKVGNFIPTGTVVVSDESRYLPCAVGNGSGCGYNLIDLKENESELHESKVVSLFEEFQKRIKIKSSPGKFEKSFYMNAFKHGLDAVDQCSDADKQKFDFNGNIYNDHIQAPADNNYEQFMPEKNYQKIFSDLEVLGGGNHFIELLSARKILNPKVAEHFNISENQLFINFHADANMVGNMAETFTPYKTFRNFDRIRRELKKMAFHMKFYGHLKNYLKQDEIFSLAADSKAGKQFLSFVFSSANYGAVNRYLLAQKILQSVDDILKPSGTPEIVADTVHDLITHENDVWVHRTGATRVIPPGESSFEPYVEYGKPVVIPVALGGPTILGVPGPATSSTYQSLPHGAGRVIDRSQAVNFTLDDIEHIMSENKVKLFRHGRLDIAREHPDGFRKFESILEALTQNNLMNVVAILEPIAVLKA